jgi:hypothetical protein
MTGSGFDWIVGLAIPIWLARVLFGRFRLGMFVKWDLFVFNKQERTVTT